MRHLLPFAALAIALPQAAFGGLVSDGKVPSAPLPISAPAAPLGFPEAPMAGAPAVPALAVGVPEAAAGLPALLPSGVPAAVAAKAAAASPAQKASDESSRSSASPKVDFDGIGEARELSRSLRSIIFGQDDAVTAMARAYRRAVSGAATCGKPSGKLLFLGPSGSGKTRLAEAAGEILGGDASATIGIDASLVREEHEIAELLDRLSQEELVRHRDPKHGVTLVLFDEIDKASRPLWGLLRRILGKGESSSDEKRVADFSKAIVVMSANARTKDMDGLIEPEDQVVFEPLSQEAAGRILDAEVRRVKQRAPVDLEVTRAAMAFIGQEGFDPRFGARKLNLAIENRLVQPLSEMLAFGQLAHGDSVRVDVNAAGDGLVYLKNPRSPRPAMMLGMMAGIAALTGPQWRAALVLALAAGLYLAQAYRYRRPSAAARDYARAQGARIGSIPGVVSAAAKTRVYPVSQYSEAVVSGVEVRYGLDADPAAIEKALAPASGDFKLWLKPAFSEIEAAEDYVRANKDAVLRVPGVSGIRVITNVVPTGEFSDSVDIFIEVRMAPGADAASLEARLPPARNGVVVRVY